MKKFVLILAGWLAFTGVGNVHADDVGDAVRAAVRRGTNTQSSTTRQKSDSVSNTAIRSTTPKASSGNTARGSTSARGTATVVGRTTTTATPAQSVISRTASSGVVSRTATPTRSVTRGTTSRTPARTTSSRSVARATTAAPTRADILSRDYSKCRAVFNDCMDEFCANKDTQLKRCACSSRANEFNKTKRQLANIDEKMLDFNQRLLTVSMNKEDAAALTIATEGEKAFYETKDISESKRTLDAIAKKLNTNFESSNFAPTIGSALSWSLDMDSAFDTIDPFTGASTAAKSGTALYSAALPVCREMAAEVCSPDDLAIAEGGYMALIEQDCNSVAKTYQSATQQAKSKVLESSALLDISRLNVHQQNNADDILTCKKKMLEMLTNSTVCGDDMGKCLDITGQYINPETGEAFLGPDLSKLNTLITRPTDGQTWTSAPGNAAFVTFLNSKKKFLAPAMEHCVDIADTVWNAFVEDALSQIKIAQLRKLEDVRQSCTTLSAQCLSDVAESLTDFDARALSIFGVAANTTANAMCERVVSSCTALLNTADEGGQWYAGIKGIQTDISYSTIRQTCDQVGRACIIQVCTSISGNFGLCENIDTSINRKSIINHTACWDQVKQCVADAGADAIDSIFTQNGFDTDSSLYSSVYNINNIIFHTDNNAAATSTNTTDDSNGNNGYVYDICATECGKQYSNQTTECRVCRLAENIWGNCEAAPPTPLSDTGSHNRIKVPAQNKTTLLYWFAQNTGTDTAIDNCRDTSCGIGFIAQQDTPTGAIMCVSADRYTTLRYYCENTSNKFSISESHTDCCKSGEKDSSGNCCAGDSSGIGPDKICTPKNTTPNAVMTFNISAGTSAGTYYPSAPGYTLYCNGKWETTDDAIVCDGYYVISLNRQDLTETRRYMEPKYGTLPNHKPMVYEYYHSGPNTICTREYTDGSGWGWTGGTCEGFTPTRWMVSIGEEPK